MAFPAVFADCAGAAEGAGEGAGEGRRWSESHQGRSLGTGGVERFAPAPVLADQGAADQVGGDAVDQFDVADAGREHEP
jgi:hypothetical protein